MQSYLNFVGAPLPTVGKSKAVRTSLALAFRIRRDRAGAEPDQTSDEA